MLRISRRGPICSRPSLSGAGHPGLRDSAIPADLICAASPDLRFACFAVTQKSLRNLGAKTMDSLQLSLRIRLPGVAADGASEGLSAPPRTRFARAGSVEMHFRSVSDFRRVLLRVKSWLKQATCEDSCFSRQYHTFVVFQGSRENH